MNESCPKCGCNWAETTGNMESYPNHYEKFYCSECGFLVGMIDNSPFTHCVEWEDNNYKIEI